MGDYNVWPPYNGTFSSRISKSSVCLNFECLEGESSPRRKWPNVNCSHSKHGNICFQKYQVSVETQKRFRILKMSLLRTGLRKVLQPLFGHFCLFHGIDERIGILNLKKIFCQPKSRFDFQSIIRKRIHCRKTDWWWWRHRCLGTQPTIKKKCYGPCYYGRYSWCLRRHQSEFLNFSHG